MGNISLLNHIIHFILGILSNYYTVIIPIFLIYQIFDGFKFNYKVVLYGEQTDDIHLDLLYFALGALSVRLFKK